MTVGTIASDSERVLKQALIQEESLSDDDIYTI
jgi:hypothetical protein